MNAHCACSFRQTRPINEETVAASDHDPRNHPDIWIDIKKGELRQALFTAYAAKPAALTIVGKPSKTELRVIAERDYDAGKLWVVPLTNGVNIVNDVSLVPKQAAYFHSMGAHPTSGKEHSGYAMNKFIRPNPKGQSGCHSLAIDACMPPFWALRSAIEHTTPVNLVADHISVDIIGRMSRAKATSADATTIRVPLSPIPANSIKGVTC